MTTKKAKAKKPNNADVLNLMDGVNAGDVIEHGRLFTRMDPDEPLAWEVLEVAETEDKASSWRKRVTFHLYYRDVFFKAMVVHITPDRELMVGAQ